MITVGAKTGKQSMPVASRYLKPKTASCHDRCKHGLQDEDPDLKRPKKFVSRKKSFAKNKRGTRIVVPVERIKITKPKPKPTPKNTKVRVPNEPVKVNKLQKSTNGKSNQKELKKGKKEGRIMKNKMVSRSTSQKGRNFRNHKLKDQHIMTKTKLKQLIAEKVHEMSLQSETAELEFTPPPVEIVQSPITTTESKDIPNPEIIQSPTTTTETNDILNSEIIQSPSPTTESNDLPNAEIIQSPEKAEEPEEVIELEESENTDNEKGIIVEDDSENKQKYRGVGREEEEDEGADINFRKGRVIDLDEEDGPNKLKFRQGRILDGEDEEGMNRLRFKKKEIEEIEDIDESEKVKLKHQEVQEKEAKGLFNSVIEETASKLVVDKKTKVGSLVGAFETVISLQEDTVKE